MFRIAKVMFMQREYMARTRDDLQTKHQTPASKAMCIPANVRLKLHTQFTVLCRGAGIYYQHQSSSDSRRSKSISRVSAALSTIT